MIGFLNVLRTSGTWHLWYVAIDHGYKSDKDMRLCYARSRDGVKWERPMVRLVNYGGSMDNNIVVSGPDIEGGFCGQTVFHDREAGCVRMVYSQLREGKWQVYGAQSVDGLRWTLGQKPLLEENSDTQTVCFRDGDIYRMYVRMWTGGDFKGIRTVGYSESRDLDRFPAPRQILAPDSQDAFDLHFYNPAATKLCDGLYVMFPTAYHTGTGTGSVHLAVSHDGTTFERVNRKPVLEPGSGFDSKMLYVAPGAVPGNSPGTYWFYYIGSAKKHEEVGADKFGGGLGRFLLVVSDRPAATMRPGRTKP